MRWRAGRCRGCPPDARSDGRAAGGGDGAQQALGVRMVGGGKQLRHGRFLDGLASIHHDHPRRDCGDDREVVSNQQDRQAHRVLQVREQGEDLGLYRHIQRRSGLVGDHERGVHDEGHRDHHALSRATGELVRIGGPAPPGRECGPPRASRPRDPTPSPRVAVHPHHLRDLLADRKDRVERGHRLLKHHPNAAPSYRAETFGVEVARSVPSKWMALPVSMRPGGRMSRRIEGRDRFSAAGFTDQTQCFACARRRARRRRRRAPGRAGVEDRAEVANREERTLRRPGSGQGVTASGRPLRAGRRRRH